MQEFDEIGASVGIKARLLDQGSGDRAVAPGRREDDSALGRCARSLTVLL
jgi:hypothetical protein